MQAMQDPAKQKKLYMILYRVFAVAAVVWVIAGFLNHPPHYILFTLIGLANWGIAYYCKLMGK